MYTPHISEAQIEKGATNLLVSSSLKDLQSPVFSGLCYFTSCWMLNFISHPFGLFLKELSGACFMFIGRDLNFNFLVVIFSPSETTTFSRCSGFEEQDIERFGWIPGTGYAVSLNIPLVVDLCIFWR